MVARAYASLCLTSAADKRQREALRFKDLALSSCKVLGEQGLLSNTLTVAAVNEAGQGSWAAAVSNLHWLRARLNPNPNPNPNPDPKQARAPSQASTARRWSSSTRG